jgi:hypothetical protein
MESSIKLQRNATSKSRDPNYYSTFCKKKKSGRSQQRAESGDRKINNSSKLSQLLLSSSSSQKDCTDTSKEDSTLKSIKKVLIKNINLQNKLNATQTKPLQKYGEIVKRESNKAIAQKIPVTCSKSPMNQLKSKPYKLAKDKNTLSSKCIKAETNSEYFVIKGNKKEHDTPSLKHKAKRNEITIVKSTSNLKDISIG